MLSLDDFDDELLSSDPKLKLDAIPGLLMAEYPMDWAWDNLAFLGQGEHGVVFAHPSEPNWVVRVSEYPDGWFSYAWSVMENAEEAWQHAPFVADLAHQDGVYLAICERLDPISEEDAEARAWLAVAQRILLRQAVDPDDLAEFCRAQPDFEELIPVLSKDCTDVRSASNWLLRGRNLVLNDPQAAMTPAEVARFNARWTRPAINLIPNSGPGCP